MSAMRFPASFPQLETKRLVMRALTLDDTEAVYRNFSNKDVTKYLMEPFSRLSQAENIIKAFLEEYQQGIGLTWAIVLKTGNTFIGTCSLDFKPGYCAEMGFDLARACWGRGYMREALKAAIAYGFADLGLRKVEAHTLLLNSRAIHLLKKLDFSVDDVVRESTWCNGRFQDEVFFSLERRDSGG